MCAAALSATSGVARADITSLTRVGPRGIGPLVIGTTPAQARATGTPVTATVPARGSSCSYLVVRSLEGVRVLVEDGTLRRVEVTTRAVRTTDGFGVGDAVAKLTAFYGARAGRARDKYDARQQRLTVAPATPADAKYRLIYVVRDERVVAIFAGALPQVAYVEGCS